MIKIACIGDSLTEGDYGISGKTGIANVHPENYPHFLAELSGAEVKNFGKCGARSSNYYKMFCESGRLELDGVSLILIMLGTNGGFDPSGEELYLKIIDYCKCKAPTAEIVLMTPPYATQDRSYSNCGYYSNAEVAAVAVRRIATERGLSLIDVFADAPFCEENVARFMPNDGLHLGIEGYQTLSAFIFDELKKRFPEKFM